MITDADKLFVAMAVDPARRSASIVKLARQRTVLFWLLIFIVLASLANSFVFNGTLGASGLMPACLLLIAVLKSESDLRLLLVVDSLRSNEKHAA
jgi:hypothetical protein